MSREKCIRGLFGAVEERIALASSSRGGAAREKLEGAAVSLAPVSHGTATVRERPWRLFPRDW
jgi:hypothetical protein